MKGLLEFYRLPIQIDLEALKKWEGDLFFLSGMLPVLQIPCQAGIVGIDWEHKSDNPDLLEIRLKAIGELNDPKWSVITRLLVNASIRKNERILQWGRTDTIVFENLYLDQDSVIYLDDHKVDLIDTINRFLTHQKSVLPEKFYPAVETRLRSLSMRYFNSDLIPALLDSLFYQFHSRGGFPVELLEITAAMKLDHFVQEANASPWLFLKIPTADLVYFLNHSVHPKMVVKGYELIFKSVEVNGVDRMIINLIETSNNWDISLDVQLGLKDNLLYPTVKEIRVEGLDILKKVLFGLFKSYLVSQIENRPVGISRLYKTVKQRIESKYPFIRILPGHEVVLDSLQISPDWTEVMVNTRLM